MHLKIGYRKILWIKSAITNIIKTD